MSDFVLFHMWEPFRESLIAAHEFYLAQAEKRLLSQFENLEEEAKKAGQEWLERSARWFDPDSDDPASAYEAAYERECSVYEALGEMRDQTRLSVVAGMFHAWDKGLRRWLAREINNWYEGSRLVEEIWKADFGRLCEFLDGLGWKITGAPFFNQLDACRLVVNCYKHGEGASFEDLKRRFPAFINGEMPGLDELAPEFDYRDYTHVKVSQKQLVEFGTAISAFWRSIPEYTRNSDVQAIPAWVEKAMKQDQQTNAQTAKK